jgi:hypothetical protein
MFHHRRTHHNRIVLRGRVAAKPRVAELESGEFVCRLAVDEAASRHNVKVTGALAGMAAELEPRQPVEVIGRLSSKPGESEQPASSHIVALAIRRPRAPRLGLWPLIKRVGGALAGFLLLVSWPGGFALALLLALGIWGAWNGRVVVEFPQLRPLRFATAAYRSATALVVLELLVSAIR